MNWIGLRGKKLLILAGAGVHSKVVQAAKEFGIYTIVTDYLPVNESPAKELADEAWMYDIKDVDSIVEKCKKAHVDGVMNYCIDPAQKPYQQICEKLGLPCIGTEKTFDILTDKRKFKDYCIAHNVDVIQEYTEADIRSGNVIYPVLMKPIDSRGSRGQSLCKNEREALLGLEKAKAESSDKESYICEKYMEGKMDIGTSFFVVNGEPYLVKLADRYLGKKEDNLERSAMCTQLPSKYMELFENNVMERVKNMIRSLDIQFGHVFLQGIVDGDTVRFYDPAQRAPGGEYDIILREATGVDAVQMMIYFALTGNTNVAVGNLEGAYKLNGGMALLVTVSVRPGKIAKAEGRDKLLEHPNIYWAKQLVPEGTVIPDSGDIQQRVAAFGIYVKEKDLIPSILNTLYDTYRVLDENGEDMIVSRYEYRP